MRRLKFRAWNKYEECFVDEEEFAINFLGTVFKANLDAEVYNNCMSQNNFEIMQHTGLKDKNGKEIYEGDILKINVSHFNGIGEIIFHKGCFMIKYSEDDLSELYGDNLYSEVIGNIYENKNLLE